jgi:hypothetical protein
MLKYFINLSSKPILNITVLLLLYIDIMATDKTSINFRNSLAMFEKLNGGSAPFVQPKK